MRGIAQLCGGWTALARECGIRPQTCIKWTRVPEKYAAIVMRLAGLPLWMIRPDLAKLYANRVRLPKPTNKKRPTTKRSKK